MAEIGLIEPNTVQTREKTWFSIAGINIT